MGILEHYQQRPLLRTPPDQFHDEVRRGLLAQPGGETAGKRRLGNGQPQHVAKQGRPLGPTAAVGSEHSV